MSAGEAPAEAVLHGVLVDVFGVGILLLGESGSGKSECALDLVSRGHRLVADDVVEAVRQGDRIVIGRGAARARHHMEVRGLGIISVRDLFGVTAIRTRKRIELIIRLEPWQPTEDYDRLGVAEATHDILGVPVPLLRIPVSAGRSIAILVEVAARNHLLKLLGVHTARSFLASLGKSGSGSPGQPPGFSREDIE